MLGRYGAGLLALTAAISLFFDLVDTVAPHLFLRRATLVGALGRLSWAWVLVAGLAAARWVWGWMPPARAVGIGPGASHRLAVTGVIVAAIGLQLWVLYNPGPILWPFTDYELYTAAHGTPVRAVHYKVFATPTATPDVEIEIPSESLDMRWFPYHTHFVPQLFHAPGQQVLDDFHRRLRASDLPALQRVEAERKTYHLEGSDLDTAVERRSIPLERSDRGQR